MFTIKTNISGVFNGFNNGRLFQLANGQVWKQVDSVYHYQVIHSPKVEIQFTFDGFRMSVEGMSQQIAVRRKS